MRATPTSATGASRTGRTDRRTGSARTFRRAAWPSSRSTALGNDPGLHAPEPRWHLRRGCSRLHGARWSRYRRRGHPVVRRLTRGHGCRPGPMLWDVTNPASPVQLGYLKTACRTRGVHELEVEHHANGRTYAYATVPTSRYPDSTSPSGYRDRNGDGDFRLIDITDCFQPDPSVRLGRPGRRGTLDWSGLRPRSELRRRGGAERRRDGRSTCPTGTPGSSSWTSPNPTIPVFMDGPRIRRTPTGTRIRPTTTTRKLLFTADEDFCPHSSPGIERGWGYLRVYDYSNAAAPQQIGSFRTRNSLAIGDKAAEDTLHNAFVVGTDVCMSWYSDGVRIVDATTQPI